MPKSRDKSVFFCSACGNESPRWEGRCPACGQWNTLAEAKQDRRNGPSNAWLGASLGPPQELAHVSTESLPRIAVSLSEVNRVLGGGIVPGSLTLIAGDPGIGKSTLLLRIAADIAEARGKVLYVSGEESAAQVKMRADRLGISGQGLYLLPTTDLDEVLGHLEENRPALAMVDSIQTLYDQAVPSEAGSVVQIRGCARRLMEWSKSRNIPIIMTGHVTKGGEVAGPRVLEHMVDVVLYMEGDPISSWRLLRAIKNRFGSTNELGVFEMTSGGLADVEDPSGALLAERKAGAVGSVIVSTLEGSRPLLVEVQALTNPTMAQAPRRVATGADFNRLLLVCAVLSRRVRLPLSNQDVVVNVAGGLRATEPAADLGLALAIASSFRNAPIPPDVVAVGEISLSGEVRKVPQISRRVREAARLGLRRCLVPANSELGEGRPAGVELIHVSTLAEALNACLPRTKPGQSRMKDESTDYTDKS